MPKNQATKSAHADLRNKSTRTNQKEHKPEEVQMRQASMYFVMGLCILSEIVSLISLVSTKDFQVILLFQMLPSFYMYRILCYLFPTKGDSSQPLIRFLQMILKR